MRLDTDTVRSLLLRHLDAKPSSLRTSPIGTGKHNDSWWVECDKGRFVLRVAPPDDTGLLFYERRMMRQEPELHALIRERTRIPVAEVVAFDFTHSLIGRDYLIMTALPGRAVSELRASERVGHDHVLRQTGGYLRELHELTADVCLGRREYGYLGAHQPMTPQPSWTEAFRVMWNRLLDDVVAFGCYAAREVDAMRDLLERHVECFDYPVEPRLLHMDVWSENILVDERGNVSGLVDFDRALWGDVEIEYAVLDYCGISEPAFWEGYGQERDASPSARVRQRFYLLYEVQKYMPIAVWRQGGRAAAERYKRHSLALASELGLSL